MAKEVELKLSLADVAQEHVQRILSELFECQLQPRALRNIYFDTESLDLNQQRIALRIRERCIEAPDGSASTGYIQTLKTKGEAVDGIHRRGEWEWPVAKAQLDLSLLEACGQWPRELALEQLKPVFETNFTRYQALLELDGAQVELAYDTGQVLAGDARSGINEIELELVAGEEAVLQVLAKYISAKLPVAQENISKAERGYALLK